ncbi:MAG: PH domain-containing protein [Bacteroidia bacterium]
MADFTNETVDINLLPKYEEVHLIAPNPKYWNVIMFNVLIFFGVSAAGLIALVYFVKEVRPFGIYIGGVYIVLFFLVFFLEKLSFKKRGYALREKDIIYKSGIIAETTDIVPLNRIQHVALTEGLFSRIYKLATLQIHTAGGATGHMNITGLPIDHARSIKDVLLRKLDLMEPSLDNDE